MVNNSTNINKMNIKIEMVNNSTNINKTNNQISLKVVEK